MTVGAQKGLAGNTESLKMYLMTDAVSRPGKMDAVFLRYAFQISVVIGIFKPELHHVVVYIVDRHLRFYSWYVHRFQLQVGHGAGGIMGQSLIDFYAYFIAWRGSAGDKMRLDDFLRNCFAHQCFFL